MYEAIKNFHKQFSFEPAIENEEALQSYDSFVVAGMGGSSLAALLLKRYLPKLKLVVHRDYGLPEVPEEILRESLVIASSYSGNTEEAIDALGKAMENGLDCAAISVGGKLIELAAQHSIPLVKIPKTGIQPRAATGYMFIALLKLMGLEKELEEVKQLSALLSPLAYEEEGKALAQKLKGFVPIIYASEKNSVLASNWKIKFNENGKIPAFWNFLPEANHNEMTGFDVKDSTRGLSKNFCFVFLRDESDDAQNKKRMDVLERLYSERGLPVANVRMEGRSELEKIFSTLVKGDWASYYTALHYGVDPVNVPMVEELKKLIS